MAAFWVALVLTFWSEMGDKTQFVALAYATRYSLRDVMVGVFAAIAAVQLVAVGFGRLISVWLPPAYVLALSAVSFLAFAVWSLIGKEGDGAIRDTNRHPVLIVGIAFFIAELGDKTMFTAATLATTHGWLPVWLGSTLGMFFSDALAMWVGRSFGKTIPEHIVKWVAAGLFALCGIWYAFQAISAFR